MNIRFSDVVDVDLAWQWLREFPGSNFDDYGPRSKAEFAVSVAERVRGGELIVTVLADEQPVGLIGYMPITERLGSFHGICFAKRVHGTGVAKRAVEMFLADLFSAGVEKVVATYFADSVNVGRLLQSVGAVEEGLLRRQTLRDGKPIDMCLIAIFKPEEK